MKKHHVIIGIAVVALAALAVWIARHTEWTETTVPMPLRGEAARNPVYAAQRFAEALGARTERGEGLELPPTDAVVVLTSWSWDISAGRRERFEAWVEAGGRLVVDRSLLKGSDAFEEWSGIRFVVDPEPEGVLGRPGSAHAAPRTLRRIGREWHDPPTLRHPPVPAPATSLVPPGSSRTSAPHGFCSDGLRIQVVRVAVGDGSVTAINAAPWIWREIFEGDHAPVVRGGTQLRAGDRVAFLSEQDHSSLLALIWRYGAPVVVISSVLLGLALWRGGARFGPLVAGADLARRSLAEQIRGTGRFALRFGGGAALHAAESRALAEAAARRIAGFGRMSAEERALPAGAPRIFTAAAPSALAPHPDWRAASPELRSQIALLEAARRRILHDNERAKHGKRSEYDHARG
jgi:hypothetical protein